MKHHARQRDYWRSLEHLAQTPEIRAMAENEFSDVRPGGDAEAAGRDAAAIRSAHERVDGIGGSDAERMPALAAG